MRAGGVSELPIAATRSFQPTVVPVSTLSSVRSPVAGDFATAKTTAPSGSSPPVAPVRSSRRAQNRNPIMAWSVEQVAVFMKKISFVEAAVIAQDNQVDGKTFLDLTDTDLKTDLGLRPLQIKRLRKEIETLEAGSPEERSSVEAKRSGGVQSEVSSSDSRLGWLLPKSTAAGSMAWSETMGTIWPNWADAAQE